MISYSHCFFFFFQAEDGIRDVAVTGVQTCALPIYVRQSGGRSADARTQAVTGAPSPPIWGEPIRGSSLDAKCSATDRKSTRLNSSHGYISYAVFCLKKKNKQQ